MAEVESELFQHRWCHPAGSLTHTPRLGDVACVSGLYWYRFDGTYWRVLQATSKDPNDG